MKEKEKENAINDFYNMIKMSWTYEKLNDEEKNKLIELLTSERIKSTIKGDYKTRWSILDSLYYAFLIGIGYNGCSWRIDEDLPF